MKNIWMYLGTAVIALILMASSATAVGIGQSAPSFELETIRGGQVVSLDEDLKGSPSLLVFWTTWCPSCRRELPNLNELAKEYQEKGVSFLGINAGWNDSHSRALAYLEEYRLDDFPMVFDSDSLVTRKFALHGVPTVILLDAQGTVRHQGFAVSRELLAKLDGLVGGE